MRLALLGKNGQLGWELVRTLAPLGHVAALDYPEIDLCQPNHTLDILRQVQPQVIINATAYTAVDRAENEPELAMAINGLAPGKLAELAVELKAALIHFSTDYVFDGRKGSAYSEDDAVNPLSTYGKTKLAGEQAIAMAGGVWLVLRTSWVYSTRRDSFLTKVLGWARQHKTLRIVSDQISNPTWARMLAEVLALVLARSGENPHAWLEERSGLYHLACEGYASRLEWAKQILQLDKNPHEQICKEVQSAFTADFPSPAQRPLFSALNCDRFAQEFGLRLPPWEHALALAMQANEMVNSKETR